MARTQDPRIDQAILDATLVLLSRDGFGALTIEDVAAAANVGKPTVYRRHRDKVSLVLAAVSRELPVLDVPDLGDTREELRLAMERGFPPDAPGYVRLIGGLIAEEQRHPELIGTFRERLLLPRRAAVHALLERGRARGHIRIDITAEQALDLFAGPLLARVFAGADTGPDWRAAAFATWWRLIEHRERTP